MSAHFPRGVQEEREVPLARPKEREVPLAKPIDLGGLAREDPRVPDSPHTGCASHAGCAVDKITQETAEIDASLELERDIEEIDRALQVVPPDATVLPGVWQYACEVHPLMAQLMPPGDISAFCVACDSLQELQGNALLLCLVAQVKYPSIVTEFAAMLATLPASFDAADLLSKCHSMCRYMAGKNDTDQLQHELYLFNNQRMGAVMGLQCVMVRLEVLEKETHRPRGCSKSKCIQLGASKPRAIYKVLHSKESVSKTYRAICWVYRQA